MACPVLNRLRHPFVNLNVNPAMRRPSKNQAPRLSADSQRLVSFSEAMVQAYSRIEERGWERELDALLQKLLRNDHQEIIDAALDHLFKAKSDAYDALMQAVEAASESCILEHDDQQYEALLIAAPILAWTRFAIAAGPLPADMVLTLTAHLGAHLLAPDTRLALAPVLYSIDQLPRSHAETHAVTRRMAQAALSGAAPKIPVASEETVPFLADTRYLLAAALAPVGAPIFRWQASGNPAERAEALIQWQTQAEPNVARLLPGCGIELLRPDAYFMSCREADKKIRPASVKAAVHYLTHTLNVTTERLSAVIGGFGEPSAEARIDEYRVSFVMRPGKDVVYGLVWPLYGDEDAAADAVFAPAPSALADDRAAASAVGEITALLREAGIVHIKLHEELFPAEFCDDCGAPLYCDLEGELMHAEMPEDAPHSAPHLH